LSEILVCPTETSVLILCRQGLDPTHLNMEVE
jgi:hypothetical protein